MIDPFVEMLKSPLAHAAARVVWKWNVCDTALIAEASSIPNDTAECVVPFESVHVNRRVTPPVPGVAHAVPVSMKAQWIWYWPAAPQAVAPVAHRVAVEIAPVCAV